MGTNYYHVTEKREPCECCGRPYEERQEHIGKSSAGWCFSLHVIPEEGINTLEDWEARWRQPGTWIEDEYGKRVTAAEMREVIAQRGFSRLDPILDAKWMRDNHAVPGPNGCTRHSIDGWHCIGHGEGTWDYIVGEFS